MTKGVRRAGWITEAAQGSGDGAEVISRLWHGRTASWSLSNTRDQNPAKTLLGGPIGRLGDAVLPPRML